MQVVGPEDECAVHGREFMAKTRPLAPMIIDGVSRGEPVGHYVCLACMHANVEREKQRADEAETKLNEVRESICRFREWVLGAMNEGLDCDNLELSEWADRALIVIDTQKESK